LNFKQNDKPVKKIISDRAEVYKVGLNKDEKNDVRVIAYDYTVENSTVLDVGCACGDFGKLLSSKRCNVYGMEYDAGSIAIASSLGEYNSIYQINLNDFNEEEYEGYFSYFDSIVALDILEHLLDPEQVLVFLTKLLKVDGSLIISLPNVAFCDIKLGILNDEFTYTDTGILDKTHIKFYTYKSIVEMMTRLGLEIEECKSKVAYFSQSNIKAPALIKRYIKQDPLSFVYQYVLKVRVSNKNKIELEKTNKEKIDLKWNDISFELSKIKKNHLIKYFLPSGSLQFKIAKKIKTILKR